MVRKSSVFAALVAATLIALCLAPPMRGQGDFVFRGGLESLTFTGENSALLHLKVAGFDAEVRVPENTRIRTASGQALALIELKTGTALEVTADWIDGAFTASVLTVPESDQVGVVGLIDLLQPDRVVVSGTEFLLDENSAPLVGQLASGQLAAVLGSVAWDGSLLAHQIVSQEQFWVFGMINRKDEAAKTVTILSRVIAIGETTKIVGVDKATLSFSGLTAGARVSVTGKSSSGRLTADEIRVIEINNLVEMRGQLLSFTEGSITIKSLDVPFVIFRDAKTEVVGTLATGVMVSISATLQPDASLLAKRIVTKAGVGDGKAGETGFVGMLEKVDAQAGTLTIGGTLVKLASGAVIRSGDKDIGIAGLKVGDKVKVTGNKQADGSFTATRVDVVTALPPTGASTVFDGLIERIAADGKSLAVGGKSVVISEKTVIQSGGKTISIKDLKVGDKVKVSGTKQSDGSYAAEQIVVISTTPTPVDSAFEGVIASISADRTSLVVGVNTVLVNDKTVIQSGSTVIKITDLKVGDKVKVKGQKLAEGKYNAVLIYLLTPAPAK